MLHRSITFTVTALVAAAILVPPPASATAETCQGRPSTIVGTGPDVVGTPGDDVIVSGTSTVVTADAGNDLICLTGATFVRTDAGPGDDVVDASMTTAVDPETKTLTDLGTGRDRFLGSPFIDMVWSNGVDDEVSTGLGRNQLRITITGMPTGVLGSYDGGGGIEGATIMIDSAAFDLEVGLGESIVVDGMRAATLTGFWAAQVAAPRVVLRGDASRNNNLIASGCEIQVDGKGGNDRIDTTQNQSDARFPCAPDDRTIGLAGGGGDDSISGGSGDLRLSGGSGNDRLFGGTQGAARIVGGGGRDRLYGGEGADRLVGGGGNDQLYGEKGVDSLVGGAGNDRLFGNAGADRLVGGAGRNRADGGRGRDTCAAEIERRCER